MIIALIDKAVESGARLMKAAATMGLSARTIIRWRHQGGGQDQRKGPSTAPANKLNEKERQQILDMSNSAPFRDLSPNQIVPKLADQGVYLASESSFYRVLKEHKMLTHRQPSKPAVSRRPKEHLATGPCKYGVGISRICRLPFGACFFTFTWLLMFGAVKLSLPRFLPKNAWTTARCCWPRRA